MRGGDPLPAKRQILVLRLRRKGVTKSKRLAPRLQTVVKLRQTIIKPNPRPFQLNFIVFR
jgi:transcriptional regulator